MSVTIGRTTFDRVVYDAALRNVRGTAFCEVAYPHRLRCPVLGRILEMSIDRRAMTTSG